MLINMIGKSMVVAAIVVAMLLQVQWSHAKSVDVGGSAGWTSFDSGQVTSPNYKAWASSQKIYIGDRLVFKFEAGVHNVWTLQSLAAYENCDFSGATLLDAGDSGFYIWKATEAGDYYFSCDKGAEGVGTHCNYNQKLAIVVSKAASAPSPFAATPPYPAVSSPSPHPPLPAAPWNSHGPAPSTTPLAPILAPSSSPVPAGPWHSPAPVVEPPAPDPLIYPVPAPSVSPVPAAPLLSPVPAPSLGPVPTAPSLSPVPAPSLSPVPAPSLSPVPAPSLSLVPAPSLSPAVTAPSPESSSPIPDMPDLSPLLSPSENGGMSMSATQPSASSSLLASLALLCVLL